MQLQALIQEFREGGGCRVGAQSAPRKIKELIIHEGGLESDCYYSTC